MLTHVAKRLLACLLVCSAAWLSACSATSGRYGDTFLPLVAQIDSGNLIMDQGVFKVSNNTALLGDGAGDTLVLSDPSTLVKFEMPDNTSVSTSEQVYELDDLPGIDYLDITLRRIGSAESVSSKALKNSLPVGFSDFYKVGGLTVQPVDGLCSVAVTITVPINTATTDTSLELFKWIPSARVSFATGKGASGIETVTGEWVFQDAAVTVNTDGTATFSTNSFGQYAVVADVMEAGT